MRIWTLAPAPMVSADSIRAFAERSEAEGWDGIMLPDNQNLWGDTFVSMVIAAAATSKILLSNGSTNPGTRHPAVLASAIAAVDQVADGRASLGVGRGDSALAHVGSAPVPVAYFQKYMHVVRQLLHGQLVQFDQMSPWRPSASIDSVPLQAAPEGSRLEWLGNGPPVQIRAFASGAKVIEASVTFADQIMFGLGADCKRLSWAMETARQSCRRTGRDPSSLAFGALMSVAVSSDRQAGRDLVANIVASTARFSSMHGSVGGPLSAAHRRVYENVAHSYNMSAHGQNGKQVEVLTPEFIDAHAVVGSAADCVSRLQSIRDLGVSDLLLIAPRNDTAASGVRSTQDLVTEVLPAIRD